MGTSISRNIKITKDVLEQNGFEVSNITYNHDPYHHLAIKDNAIEYVTKLKKSPYYDVIFRLFADDINTDIKVVLSLIEFCNKLLENSTWSFESLLIKSNRVNELVINTRKYKIYLYFTDEKLEMITVNMPEHDTIRCKSVEEAIKVIKRKDDTGYLDINKTGLGIRYEFS